MISAQEVSIRYTSECKLLTGPAVSKMLSTMKKLIALSLLSIALAAPGSANAENETRIIDGDTLRIGVTAQTQSSQPSLPI
tara:strand:- start:9255 stop:9497 length:243 start_codon:yes stop_codon:yes gene_type:complete